MSEDLLKIINHYGVNAQQRQLAEEVFELQEAITQYEDPRIPKIYRNTVHIAEEIADVMVMLYQFKNYYDIHYDTIYEFMQNKVKRQLERIKNEVL